MNTPYCCLVISILCHRHRLSSSSFVIVIVCHRHWVSWPCFQSVQRRTQNKKHFAMEILQPNPVLPTSHSGGAAGIPTTERSESGTKVTEPSAQPPPTPTIFPYPAPVHTHPTPHQACRAARPAYAGHADKVDPLTFSRSANQCTFVWQYVQVN